MEFIKREISISAQILFILLIKPWFKFASGPKQFFKFQIIFFIGMTISLQILFNDSWTRSGQEVSEKGDALFYWKRPLNIHYADYVKSVVLRLVIRPPESRVIPCDRSAYSAHDRVGGLPVREIHIGQPLGDTAVGGIQAYLDERVPGRRYLRLLAVGLYPGPGDLYCHFPCSAAPGEFCSSRATGVVLLAGNHTSYPEDGERKSFKDVISMACPVSAHDLPPNQMSLTSRSCGYSHNYIQVQSRHIESYSASIGLCVRPTSLSKPELKTLVARYVEYWRYLGIDQIYFYYSDITRGMKGLLKVFEAGDQLVTSVDWTTVSRQTEEAVAAEAAVNHCVTSAMTSLDYVIVASFDHVPLFLANETNSLKHVITDPKFQQEIKLKSGFRFTGPGTASFILNPKVILATAANHFIPLSGRASFHMMHPFDITMLSMSTLWFKDDKLKLSKLRKVVDAAALKKLGQQKEVKFFDT